MLTKRMISNLYNIDNEEELDKWVQDNIKLYYNSKDIQDILKEIRWRIIKYGMQVQRQKKDKEQ